LKVVESRFGFDKDDNPAVISKCKMEVFETSGKFQMGFGLARDRQTGELYLFAFRDHVNNPIAILRDKQKAIEWIDKALEKNGYKWYHIYTSDVEKVDGMWAFAVPFDAEGWNELPESVRTEFQKMISLLRETKTNVRKMSKA